MLQRKSVRDSLVPQGARSGSSTICTSRSLGNRQSARLCPELDQNHSASGASTPTHQPSSSSSGDELLPVSSVVN